MTPVIFFTQSVLVSNITGNLGLATLKDIEAGIVNVIADVVAKDKSVLDMVKKHL